MNRLLLTFSVLFCSSIGAFFLYVPPLLIAAALTATMLVLLTGLLWLLHFDFQAELQPVSLSDPKD